ncbi:p21-activated protein kinase-interacting protein 1-like isoform X2 [Patella vulgata]|uniref:p21-activated protein kinase-interacting protein 1-like isoform X2 n=1 Tax=Patella vulgata TaxID=6465 RepID=UPI00217F36A9|nr:p21-activated protein kinase-interacting protein 1-like isoform X2 [Patella vulgata]
MMNIVVGTYEELILGYKLDKNGDEYKFEQTFTDHSHLGCIKSAGISRKNILATGSTDETIRLFNLKKHTELGALMHHSGNITQITFFQDSHMFSTSEDGTMCVWKNYTWECLRQFRGHKGPVNSVSVHPSGRMAITVSKDKTLRTWNLVTGRHAFISNIKEVADWVMWSPNGEHYAVSFYYKINVYKLEDAAIHCTIQADKRINNIVFINDCIIAFGGEGGKLILYDFIQDKELESIHLKCTRIKGISCSNFEDDQSPILIATASDGNIWAYSVDTVKGSLEQIAAHDTKFRITCLAVTPPNASKKLNKEETLVLEKLDEDLQENGEEEDQETEHVIKKDNSEQKARKGSKGKKDAQKRKSNSVETITEPTSQKTKKIQRKKKKIGSAKT